MRQSHILLTLALTLCAQGKEFNVGYLLRSTLPGQCDNCYFNNEYNRGVDIVDLGR